MKALLKLLSIALAVPLLCSCSNDKEEKQETNPITRMEESKTRISYIDCSGIPRPDDAFDYPYQNDHQWKEIDTYEKPFQIPQDIVEKQSTMALVRDVLEHPKMFYLTASNSTTLDLARRIYDQMDVFKALCERKDVGDCFLEVFQLFNPEACGGGGFIKVSLFLLTAQPEIYENFTSAQRKGIMKETLTKYRTKFVDRNLLCLGEEEAILLVGRLLQAEKYEPFLNEISNDEELKKFIEYELTGAIESKEDVIISYANKYLTR